MPSRQPGIGPRSLPAGQPPWPCWDPTVIPMTLAAALPYALSQTQPGPSWAALGQWASLDTTETCSEVQGAVCPSCPFPSFPEHVSLMSSSTSRLLLPAHSPLCCQPSRSLDPLAYASRQADSPTQGGCGARQKVGCAALIKCRWELFHMHFTYMLIP